MSDAPSVVMEEADEYPAWRAHDPFVWRIRIEGYTKKAFITSSRAGDGWYLRLDSEGGERWRLISGFITAQICAVSLIKTGHLPNEVCFRSIRPI